MRLLGIDRLLHFPVVVWHSSRTFGPDAELVSEPDRAGRLAVILLCVHQTISVGRFAGAVSRRAAVAAAFPPDTFDSPHGSHAACVPPNGDAEKFVTECYSLSSFQ